MDENKIKYGLKNVYYAKATFDEDGFPEYETPVHIPGAVSLALDAEGESEPWYADNMVYTVLNGNAGYSGDLEIAMIPESFATEILHEEVDANGLMQEQTGVEIEHFALLFQFEGDKKAIRHVFYNCTCSRPAIESATTEDTKEPQTDTLQLEAMPLASGYVKGKTCSRTPDGVYDGFFDEVLVPGGEGKTYTVYFYDGNTLLQTVTNVPYGGSATYTGSMPAKEGYIFTGWDPAPTNITGNTYCYAQFEIQTFTVRFYNGSTILQTVTDVPYGGSATYTGATPVSPDNPDLQFLGWDPEPTNIKKDTDCYAQFEAQTYTVYFYNGDTLLQTVTGVVYGGSAAYTGSTPVSSEDPDATFIGWDPEPINIVADTYCYAKYNYDTFTVYFYNGSTLLQTVTDVPYGATVTYDGDTPENEDPNYAYKIFIGWDPEPVNIMHDTKCYAQYSSEDAFAVFSADDNSLIFYIDDMPSVRSQYNGKTVTEIFTQFMNISTHKAPPWEDIVDKIELVSFDSSFAIARTLNLHRWFTGMSNCVEINLKNLNTELVKSFDYAFYKLNLKEIDLSPLNTENATAAQDMFGESDFETLDLSSLDFSNVTIITMMFYNCVSLKSVRLPKFGKGVLINISNSFEYCSSLEEIDVSEMDTSITTNMGWMFQGCTSLKTIYSNDDVFVTDSSVRRSGANMFTDCENLVGGNGTIYNYLNVSYSMAHVDTEDNPGYFTAK